MTRIYLVDYIGRHCGMDYYLEAFKRVLGDLPDVDVKILSNYSAEPGMKPFFVNHYKGGKLNKGFSFLKNLMVFRKFARNHRDDLIIYLTYGNMIDIPFMKIASASPRHMIDIHEAVAQNVDSDRHLIRMFTDLYKNRIRNVISHSARTDEYLTKFGYRGKVFRVPHFRYVFKKSYMASAVPAEVRDTVSTGKSNLLFFGNLNRSKGVDLLIKAFNMIDPKIASKLNLIIAGKDFDGSVNEVTPAAGRNVHIIRRHISDDELRYLYEKADYICLPYRKTSQSGILEMAFYFRKPIVATDLPYFRQTLQEFPSFGIISGTTPEEYARTLSGLGADKDDIYFKDDEYARYENRREVNDFKESVNEWLRISR